MKNYHKKITTLLAVFLALSATILFGAGCLTKNEKTISAGELNLRQPAPPASPVSDPVIPPEAKNVPKPY